MGFEVNKKKKNKKKMSSKKIWMDINPEIVAYIQHCSPSLNGLFFQ